jgi:subtilisin-like proprotein convertase family protein
MNSTRALYFYSAMVCVSMGATFACGDDGETTDEGTGGRAAANAGEGGAPPTTTGGKASTGGNKSGSDAGSGGVFEEPGTGGAPPTAGSESTGGRQTTGGRPGGGGNGDAGSGDPGGGKVSVEGGSGGSGEEGGAAPVDPECAAGFWGPGCQPCTCAAGSCDDGIDGDGSCTCPTGLTGPNCDRCASGFQDRDEDGTCEEACATNTCSNHGNCDDSLGEVRCSCFTGYTASRCTECAVGYQDNDDNTTCLRACDEDTCNDHGECDDADGTVGCECSGGYTGAFCDNCEEGDQDNDDNGTCTPACDEETCSGAGDCDDESGTATCTCDTGYDGDDCSDCAEGYQDNDDNDSCEPACVEDSCSSHGDCDDEEGAISCDCDTGYTGDACEECDDGYVDDGDGGCVLDEPDCVEYEWSGSVGIPDDTNPGITQDLEVSEDFIVGDVNLTVSINHVYIGEMNVELEHGTTTTLVAANNCISANWVGIILDDEGTQSLNTCTVNLTSPPSYTPNNALSAFDDVSSAGTWTIHIYDNVGADQGTFTYAKLRICDGEG